MTPEIAVVLGTIVVAIMLFITERLPMELVALLVLVGLAVSGLLTPAEALSGFSNPAVVTVWAVFILSGGMARTGVAGLLGRQVLRLSGHRAGSSTSTPPLLFALQLPLIGRRATWITSWLTEQSDILWAAYIP
ncbi:MAG: SLC13 family permease [Anaerolineae bacterium]|nr:SLC13 family permease [Anaerolineae bacterium]